MKTIALLASLALAACAASAHPSTPLQAAMVSTVHALAAANAAAMRSGIAGLAPCDVTVSFALTSSAGGSLGVALKPPQIPVGIDGEKSRGEQAVNTVTVDFKSPACIKALAKQPVRSQ